MCTNQHELTRRALLSAGTLGVLGGALWPSRALAAAGALLEGEDPRRVVAAEAGAYRLPVDGVAVPAPRIVTRAEWGADETIGTPGRTFAPIRKLIVHHTATSSDPADPAAEIRAVQRHHVLERGYDDIAYNFLVDHRGTIYEGRRARTYAPGEVPNGESEDGQGVVGAHSFAFNTGTCGIALVGTYSTVPPPTAALGSLAHLLAWKAGPRSIDLRARDEFTNAQGVTGILPNLLGHRDVVSTDCPGDGLYGAIDSLGAKASLRARRGLVGYRVVLDDATVVHLGGAIDTGQPRAWGGRDAVAIAAGPDADSFRVASADGGLACFGNAWFFGSLPSIGVRARAVDLATTPSGHGYWILGVDGGVFSFGDAEFHGSLPGIGVRTTARRIRSTRSGHGYWILGTDGGIFSFGDAPFLGSLPGIGVQTRAVDLAPTPSGRGYWILGEDGGVFTFGDAAFFGSVPGLGLRWARPARALMAAADGQGYHVLANDGGVFSFGSVPFHGSTAGHPRPPAGIAPAYQS